MTPTTALALPHTGLQVPHDRIGLLAPGLVGLDGRLTGQVVIEDDVEAYEPVDDRLSVGGFFDYVAGCRLENGDPVDVETLLDMLRAEYATGRALVRAADAGGTVAQAMVPYGCGYLPDETLLVLPEQTRQDVIVAAEDVDTPRGTWWRIYDGEMWVDLDPTTNTTLGGTA